MLCMCFVTTLASINPSVLPNFCQLSESRPPPPLSSPAGTCHIAQWVELYTQPSHPRSKPNHSGKHAGHAHTPAYTRIHKYTHTLETFHPTHPVLRQEL